MYTNIEIREKYLEFFKSKGHNIIPSSSIVPENDPSTLFTSSGMQPLVRYLLGEKHPEGNRLCNSQKCFRAEDIENIGDNRHITFFEMLGNWSLGDYFKEEQLNWIYQFLIEELKIDPKRLYATVHKGNQKIGIDKDLESVEILKRLFKKYGIEANEERIFYYGDEKNWWSKSGVPEKMPIGEPGGPDSEIFYDLGADLKKHENSPWLNQPCHPNCDCGRFIEIGNSVFMEYIKTKDGFKKLSQQNVDFGGGLERITMVVQELDNVFKTDLFINIINKIQELSEKEYESNIKSFEIIADHLKAATFIMGDDKGIAPSNLGQGYIVRRLIRRAIRYGRLLGIQNKLWTTEIAKVVVQDYSKIYSELQRNTNFVIAQLKNEEAKFNKTIEKGLKEFERVCSKKTNENIMSGRDVFNLYQTYGFPIEMTVELAEEKGLKIDENEYKRELEKHQKLSRTASVGMFRSGLIDTSEKSTLLHTATHLMLAALRRVLGNHVVQKGSNITAERLRFDFSHNEKMTSQQIEQVENLVNEDIKKNLPVRFEEMTLEKAKTIGALGAFDSKYGKKVMVYIISNDREIVSREICAGPHIEKTGTLGHFKIIKEESVSAGTRRIRAILE